jgi:uncharacterized protein involved in exopolysaccharide biosynthesis
MAFLPTGAREDEPPPLSELLAHVHVRRRGARAVFALVFGAALLIAAILPAQYRATASIAVVPSPEFTVRQNAGSHAYTGGGLAFDQIMEAESAILQSDDLHEATIGRMVSVRPGVRGIVALYPDMDPAAQPFFVLRALHAAMRLMLSPWRDGPAGQDGPMDAALRRFAAALRVLPTKDSNVVTLNFTNSNAVMAAQALNAMLDRYAERRRRLYDDPQLAVARREADAMAEAVRQADRALSAFKAERGFSDYAAERDLLLRRRSQSAQTLADARATQAQSQARLAMLERQIAHLPVSAPLFVENDTDTRLVTIDASLVDLRGRLNAAREHYRDGSHLVTGLQTQIRAREGERTRMIQAGPASVVRSGRSPVLDPLLLSRAQAAADHEAAGAQAESVQGEIDAINASLRGLNADEEKLADLTRRRQAAEDGYASTSRAASEQSLTEAEDARRLANVRIIQPARVPMHQTATKLLICLAGLVVGGMAALAWLLARFVGSATFLTAPGLEYASGLPVLAVFREETLVS